VGQDKTDAALGGPKAAPTSPSGLAPRDSSPVSSEKIPPASDVWVAVPTRTYDHMAKVARDAQSLLDALQSNVEKVRDGFVGDAPELILAQGLRDIETCCERLNNMLEDALVGVRRDGLTLQRTSVSIASIVASAMKQVRATAEARRVSFGVVAEPDVAARLDRTLLTRALAKLMGRIIGDSDPGSEIAVSYRLDRADIRISLVSNTTSARVGRASLRPREDVEADLEFCHLVAECHGGTLTVGASGAPTYRLDLPWQDAP
jgi:hypothetical protein